LTAEYVSRIFEEPWPALEGYSDAELNMGLNYLISPGLGEHMRCLDDPSVPLAARLRCVQACECFANYSCRAVLPICRTVTSPGRSPLNAVCYMWWDIMPVYGDPRLEDRHALHRASLDAMATVLDFESLACAESALHGLGHWHRAYPERVESLIDGFLATHSDARPELLTYARSARYGCVL